MANTPEDRQRLVSEMHQFISLVRARLSQIADIEQANDERAGDRHMDDWRAVYGRVTVELDPGEDLTARMGEVIYEKVNCAAAVAAKLAVELAGLTDLTPIQVLDRIEQSITDAADEEDD